MNKEIKVKKRKWSKLIDEKPIKAFTSLALVLIVISIFGLMFTGTVSLITDAIGANNFDFFMNINILILTLVIVCGQFAQSEIKLKEDFTMNSVIFILSALFFLVGYLITQVGNGGIVQKIMEVVGAILTIIGCSLLVIGVSRFVIDISKTETFDKIFRQRKIIK